MNKKKDSTYRGKVVVVGDGSCGKTCFLVVYRSGKFLEDYIPTVVDNFVQPVDLGDAVVNLTLWDTSGQEDYAALRPLSYSNADLVIICYAIDCKDVFGNVEEQWAHEVKTLCPKTPFFLVGLKSDKRKSTEKSVLENLVTPEEGQAMATKIGARTYWECSSKENHNVKEIFEDIGKYIIEHGKSVKTKKKKRCICF